MSVYVGEVGVGWDYLCDQRYTISGKDVAYSLNVCQTRKKKYTEKRRNGFGVGVAVKSVSAII